MFNIKTSFSFPYSNNPNKNIHLCTGKWTIETEVTLQAVPVLSIVSSSFLAWSTLYNPP